jgi:hypothetical protein
VQLGAHILQHRQASRHQYQVDARGGELMGELAPDSG